jgi:hypothetical protein
MRRDLYLLKNSYRENRRYDIEHVLYIILKILMEKIGDIRYGLVLFVASLKPFMRNLVRKNSYKKKSTIIR